LVSEVKKSKPVKMSDDDKKSIWGLINLI
jgi:hypothetical protein